MTWKDGGGCGRIYREIVNEDESIVIAKVRTKYTDGRWDERPWPEGEGNFALILAAPKMLEALEEIAELDPEYWCGGDGETAVCDECKQIARTAIAAVKGEESDDRQSDCRT